MDQLQAGQTLIWRQVGIFKREWHIQAEGAAKTDRLARLRQPSLARGRAEVHWAGDEQAAPYLTLRITGILRQVLLIESPDLNLPLPIQSDLSLSGRHAFTLANGRAFTWVSTNFWRTRWELRQADSETPLIQAAYNPWQRGGRLQLGPALESLPLPEAWLLVSLCWYLMIIQMQRAAAASAAGAS